MWQREMVWELKQAKSRERRAILERYTALYGHSKEQLYRIAKEFNWCSGRKERADKGIGILAEEQIDIVGAFLEVTRRENKGAFTPIENAMDFAITNGFMRPGEVSVSTMQRNLRERSMSKQQLNAPTPHTAMRSLHPNHVHAVDASTCIQFYLADGGMKIMREDEFYKNKLQNYKKIDRTLQRYLLVDHFSGMFFPYYYEAAAESSLILFDFLCRAWETKAEKKCAFQGVPKLLLGDGGTRAKAKAMGAGFWEGIDVDIPPGMPGNSRRQGGVETHHKIWEEWFEARLRIEPASSLEELNRRAIEFAIWFNATRTHTRHQMKRLSCWLTITEEQLRILPERAILQDLMNKPEDTRTVTNHRISFEGKDFNLKHANIPHGTKVKVIKNIWKWQQGIITVGHDNHLYEAKAIEMLPASQGGFEAGAAIIGESYKAQPHTAAQKARKRLNELASGSSEPSKKDIPFVGMNVFEGRLDMIDNLAVFPKKGRLIEVARPADIIQYPITELFKRLIRAEVKVTKEINQALRAEYGDTIDGAAMDAVIRQQSEGASLGPVQGLSLVVNR